VRTLALAALLASTSAAAAPARILLQDVTVIDGTGAAARPHCDVAIDGARIATPPSFRWLAASSYPASSICTRT
jgi:hypothetical protein